MLTNTVSLRVRTVCVCVWASLEILFLLFMYECTGSSFMHIHKVVGLSSCIIHVREPLLAVPFHAEWAIIVHQRSLHSFTHSSVPFSLTDSLKAHMLVKLFVHLLYRLGSYTCCTVFSFMHLLHLIALVAGLNSLLVHIYKIFIQFGLGLQQYYSTRVPRWISRIGSI